MSPDNIVDEMFSRFFLEINVLLDILCSHCNLNMAVLSLSYAGIFDMPMFFRM